MLAYTFPLVSFYLLAYRMCSCYVPFLHIQATLASLEHIYTAAGEEDQALEACPGRAEMLEALRGEFPGIDFTTK